MYNYKEYLKIKKEIKKELIDDYFVRKYAAASHQNMSTKQKPTYNDADKTKFYKFWFDAIKKDKIVEIIKFITFFKNNILDINKSDENGNTGLLLACKENNEEIVNYILELPGIDPNIQNNNGETALIVSINWDIIKKLLVLPNINLYLKDNNNKTFFDYYDTEDSKLELKKMLSSYTLQKTIANNDINNIFIFWDYNILNQDLIPEIIAKDPDYEDIFKDLYVGFEEPKRKTKKPKYIENDDL